MEQVKLGKLLDGPQDRDAIHQAVFAVQAGERLNPGQKVGISRVNGKALAALPMVGVVDPWLEGCVEVGQWFWLCIKPGDVTGLRHHYTHYAFDRREANVLASTKMTVSELAEVITSGNIPVKE